MRRITDSTTILNRSLQMQHAILSSTFNDEELEGIHQELILTKVS